MAIIKLLVVVDNSLASIRAVAYVAQMLGGRRGFQVWPGVSNFDHTCEPR